MKLMKSFLTLSFLCLMISCSKEEANVSNDVFTNDEFTTYEVLFPEGITLENAAEWFNQLSEEEREMYIRDENTVNESNEATPRSCGTWSSWSGWLIERQTFSGLSRSCPNPQSQEFILKRRSRERQCSHGPETETQTSSTTTCYPPC